MKPASVATPQAGYKPYAYIHYLRGAQFVNRLVVDGVAEKCEQTSQLQKNKGMDSMKPASIATSQAGYKPYAYIHYLRGAQFVNRVVVDGVAEKCEQTSQLQKTKVWIP